jgi:hypothetical protein
VPWRSVTLGLLAIDVVVAHKIVVPEEAVSHRMSAISQYAHNSPEAMFLIMKAYGFITISTLPRLKPICRGRGPLSNLPSNVTALEAVLSAESRISRRLGNTLTIVHSG